MIEGGMIERIARLIDPQVWEAQESDQTTLGSQFDFSERRHQSLAAAERVLSFLEPQCSAGLVKSVDTWVWCGLRLA